MSGREISKNIVKIDIRILALLIAVVFFSIVILFLSVNISSNKYEQEDETAMKMTGIYYGDGATAECKPGYLCRSGYSSEQYVELRDDRTCNTNINFIGWTLYYTGHQISWVIVISQFAVVPLYYLCFGLWKQNYPLVLTAALFFAIHTINGYMNFIAKK